MCVLGYLNKLQLSVQALVDRKYTKIIHEKALCCVCTNGMVKAVFSSIHLKQYIDQLKGDSQLEAFITVFH